MSGRTGGAGNGSQSKANCADNPTFFVRPEFCAEAITTIAYRTTVGWDQIKLLLLQVFAILHQPVTLSYRRRSDVARLVTFQL
jgi:hypothetical protein